MTSYRHDFEAIGTHWSIDTDEKLTPTVLSQLHDRTEQFDRTYSRFRPDSLVTRLAKDGGTAEFPDDASKLFAFYRKLYDATSGKVTPLVGAVLEHLGYDAGYSLVRRPGYASVPEWDDVLTVQGNVLAAAEPVLLDLGAAGKGYLVDILAELLDAAGITCYLIDASGDIVARGPVVSRVGLENPLDPTTVIGVADLHDAALCGSATNRRTWGEGLHHIVDPTTAEPTREVVATWVVAPTAMVADGLATALFLTEPNGLAEHFDFSYVRIPAAGGVEYSINFDGELFT